MSLKNVVWESKTDQRENRTDIGEVGRVEVFVPGVLSLTLWGDESFMASFRLVIDSTTSPGSSPSGTNRLPDHPAPFNQWSQSHYLLHWRSVGRSSFLESGGACIEGIQGYDGPGRLRTKEGSGLTSVGGLSQGRSERGGCSSWMAVSEVVNVGARETAQKKPVIAGGKQQAGAVGRGIIVSVDIRSTDRTQVHALANHKSRL